MDNQNNQRYNEIGDRIQKSVVEALQTGEFANLNNEIRDSVRAVLNDVGGQINDAVSAAKTQARSELGFRDAYKGSNGQTAQSRGFTNGYNTDSSMKDLERHNLLCGLQNGIQKKEILKNLISFIVFAQKN